MNCPRCEAVELELTLGNHVSFAECPRCHRQFRVTAAGDLVEKWLGPLSLVLYPVIFETRPQNEAERIANELYAASKPGRRSIFRSFSRDELGRLLAEMRLELEHPSQKVRDVLALHAEEEDLRQYLARVAERLGELMRE